MVVHISFGKQVYKATRKDLTTNILALTGWCWIALLRQLESISSVFIAANLGGIYSLFIGFSAITFFEIIYYFGVRFYMTYRQLSTGRNSARR